MTDFGMIDLEILTDDERKRELIRRYWKLNSSGTDFAESLETLKKEFGLSRGSILGIVRSNSRAVSKIHVCECGHRKVFDCRKDFRSTPKRKPFVCQECAKEETSGSAEADTSTSDLSSSGTPEEEAPEMLSEESLLQNLLASFGPSGDGASGAIGNLVRENQSLDLNGEDTRRLQQALRDLARLLSTMSRRVEQLSHQVATDAGSN